MPGSDLGKQPCRKFVSVQEADFDLSVELARLRADDPDVGAVCCFVGTVRELHNGDALESMFLEHYPGMTETSIRGYIDEAVARFDIRGVRVIHRIGTLHPLDQIVLVAVTSSHRGSSFDACEFVMDHLKTGAPFWKKERAIQGERWVEARGSDEAAAQRWGA